MILRWIAISVLAISSLGLTACSGNGRVQSVDVGTYDFEGEEYVKVSSEIKTGDLQLASISLPIMNPRSPGQVIGDVSVERDLGGKTSTLTIKIKSSALFDLAGKTHAGTLPNGIEIPITGVEKSKWFMLPLGSAGIGNSRLYINLDLTSKKLAIGSTLSIDVLRTPLPSAVLLPFTSNHISGLAGLYTGPLSGQSGFALFVDASGLFENQLTINPMNFNQRTSRSETLRIQKRVDELQKSQQILKIR